jgi:hypothetical protein
VVLPGRVRESVDYNAQATVAAVVEQVLTRHPAVLSVRPYDLTHCC